MSRMDFFHFFFVGFIFELAVSASYIMIPDKNVANQNQRLNSDKSIVVHGKIYSQIFQS